MPTEPTSHSHAPDVTFASASEMVTVNIAASPHDALVLNLTRTALRNIFGRDTLGFPGLYLRERRLTEDFSDRMSASSSAFRVCLAP